MSDTRCVACGATSREFAFEGHDWYMGAVGGTYHYWTCRGCGSARLVPQPSDAELDRAYAASYGPFRARQTLVERLGEPLAQREATRLSAIADPAGSLLDIGCGGGAMLRRLRVAGWSGPLRGVEPSEDVARRTSRQLRLPVDVAPVEALPAAPASVDTVVLRHVIEHVRDPLAVLARIREVLRPGGFLYLATPDRRALAARAFGRHWHGYDPPRHLFAFTAPGVRSLLAGAGFEVVEERWDFAPQMWTASLHHRFADSRLERWANPLSSLMNPLVGGPAVLASLAEIALRRSTMYGATARRI